MATPTQAAAAENFIQSIGVNTHLSATGSTYGNVQAVESQLGYLGVDHVRDVVPTAATLSAYQAVGAYGATFDLIVMGDPAQAMGSLDAMAPYLTSVEGPNEVNVTPVTYQGMTGAAAAVALQKALYTDVHADPTLNGNGHSTPVLNFSVSPAAVTPPTATCRPMPITPTSTTTGRTACRRHGICKPRSAAPPIRRAARRS